MPRKDHRSPRPTEDVNSVASARRRQLDPLEFIKTNLPIEPVPAIPDIRLHMARPASNLWRLVRQGPGNFDPPSPYWAYLWAGGAALARYFLDHPEMVKGRRVLDLGAGSGIVGIAAAKAGASKVIAADIDPYAALAVDLNAAANGVAVETIVGDIMGGSAPPADIVGIGDLFYEADLAERVLGFLDSCLAAGMTTLIGDPGRTYLPRSRLRLLAEYSVPDFGDVKGAAMSIGCVFMLDPAQVAPSVRNAG
ncbi:methyltransferase [Mesorhizobium sp. BAC0120]|uniref:class I SAM-dependent methyltransferase n=1 Tax=Mesorhizobium sp. BAC0120 TaxID=3090670 RepID=UPI00298C0871|nr:methyltransferase [Mesorhizobium sp. BAC0120]MDW6025270.1 methyltransferase [Mesorhizobium sp. BAC0120]